MCGAEDLLINPAEERVIELHQLLTRYVGQHRATLALVHQVPHRRDRRLAAALVGNLGIVGNEVEFPAAMTKTALLDFMTAHRRLAGVDGAQGIRWLRACVGATGHG